MEHPPQAEAAPAHRRDASLAAEVHAQIDAKRTGFAVIRNERCTYWTCDCCNESIKVPTGVAVVHGDYTLRYDSWDGLSINGKKVSTKTAGVTETTPVSHGLLGTIATSIGDEA